MNKEQFWIFSHLGLGDHVVCNALYRHYAKLYKDKIIIIPCWIHNLAAIQWMLSDVQNIFFYPVDTEAQFLTCKNGIEWKDRLTLGFYKSADSAHLPHEIDSFNPVKWDSEFYIQAGLDPELKWIGFKLPDFKKDIEVTRPFMFCHHDEERGFSFRSQNRSADGWFATKETTLMQSATSIYLADEIHCIDSSMLNLADLMETPYCKKFVFHQYARKGLPPTLRKSWEIIL